MMIMGQDPSNQNLLIITIALITIALITIALINYTACSFVINEFSISEKREFAEYQAVVGSPYAETKLS